MRVNAQGLHLLQACEGLRLQSYRDSVGVWTIGYGHTSMAGPPVVTSTLKISRAKAEEILARDVDLFANGVAGLLHAAHLTDNQFSALVVFAYNVGLGNFRSSSVLRAVNDGKLDLVPRRLALWVKAGGRTLSGLVKRRSAEASLFMLADANNLMEAEVAHFRADELEEMALYRGQLDAPTGTPLTQSTTVLATVLGAVPALMATVSEAMWKVRDLTYGVDLSPRTYMWLAASVVIVACAGWIISERHKKAQDEDV